MPNRLDLNIRWRLSVLWLLEWGISGTIMTFLPIYLSSISLSKAQQGQLMATTAIGLWVAPFLVGQVADRWMAAERYLAISHFVGAAALYALANASELYQVTQSNFPALLVLWGVFAAAYFPTVPLASSLCFRHLPDPDAQFGKVRVWGTVGWMLAGVGLSLWLSHDKVFEWLSPARSDAGTLGPVQAASAWLPRPSQSDCFRISALLAFTLSVFSLFLPNTPPMPAASDRVAPLALMSMFRDRTFSLFMVVSFLVATLIVPLYSLAIPNLLQRLLEPWGVHENWVPTVMLVGQISEFPSLMLLSFCLKRFGLKATFALGIVAWALRYAIFAIAAPWWLVLGGLALHGVCHVFLVIVGQLYIDSQCRTDLRASAQSLLSFVTLGVGMPLGALLAGELADLLHEDSRLLFAIPCAASILLVMFFWRFVPLGRSARVPTPGKLEV